MKGERRVVVPSPENSETPLSDVQSWVTPVRLFFVRNHFDTPEIDLSQWRLRIEGCVERELELSWEQLNELPARSVFATMECAGNGRSFLRQPVEGVQWGAGAVGHAEWTGVPLALVLQRAGLRADAIEIVAEGADCGSEKGHPDPMPFAHGLPREKALHPDTLLALRMNGEPLEPSHGFPVRLLVPGWYGVCAVKWLTRLTAVSEPFGGYFQTVKYTVRRRTGRGEEVEAVGPMPVKSEIIRPGSGETLGLGMNRILGFAWAGEEAVAAVEVSVDGGRSWGRADLKGLQAPYSWTLWEYLWEAGAPGEYQLLSRAVSDTGRVQPLGHDPLHGGYMIHFSRPTLVRVDAARRSGGVFGDASLLQEVHAFAEERARLPLDVELELTYGAGI